MIRSVVRVVFSCSLVVVTFSGCGSDSTTIVPPKSAPSAVETASLTFAVRWPAVASRASRGRSYLSQSTQSIAITIGASTPTTFDNPNVAGQPAQTQNLAVSAPVGSDDVTIAAYDATAGAGNLLGRVSTTISVAQNAANVLALTLNGELHAIGIVPVANQPLLEGSLAAGYTLVGAQPATVNLVPYDADGNVIIAPGTIPPLGLSSAASAIGVAATSTPNQYTISAPAPTAFVTLTASGTDLNGTSVSTTFKADALAAIYVTSTRTSSVNAVSVFDENGNTIALPATAFAGVNTGTGVTYVAATKTNPPMLMVSDEFTDAVNSNAAGATFAFDLAGNPIATIPPTGANGSSNYTGTDGPLFTSFAPTLGTGELLTPNLMSSQVAFYDRSLDLLGCYGCESPVTTTFTKLIYGVGIYYDPTPPAGNPVYFVTDDSGNTATSLQEYSADGKSLIGSASAGLEAHGITWDKDDKYLIISTKVTGAPALVDPYSIVEYNESLTNETPTSGFLNNGLKSAQGIVYDPNDKEIYAADSTGSQVLVFTVAGAAVTTSGKFPGLNAAKGIEYVP